MEKKMTTGTKSGRELMASVIEALATTLGAKVARLEGEGYPGHRVIRLEIEAAKGLRVGINLDGKSKDTSFLLAWNIQSDAKAMLTNVFGEVNQHHFSKATHIAFGFEDLKRQITRGLTMARDGTAFRSDSEVESLTTASRARYQAMVKSSRKQTTLAP